MPRTPRIGKRCLCCRDAPMGGPLRLGYLASRCPRHRRGKGPGRGRKWKKGEGGEKGSKREERESKCVVAVMLGESHGDIIHHQRTK